MMKECMICKQWSKDSLYHEHFSTRFLYNNHNEDIIECILCKSSHKVDLGHERITVLMTTDLLHEHFKKGLITCAIHVNLEVIQNGRLKELKESWVNLYGEERKPIDVIIIAGIQDIPFLSVSEMTAEIESFKCKVLKQHQDSTFTFAEMYHPPAFSWFEKMGPKPEGFTNYLTKIESVNREIKCFNKKNDRRLNFSNWGIRTRRKRDREGNLINVPEHKFTDWIDSSYLNEVISQKLFSCVEKFITCQLSKRNIVKSTSIGLSKSKTNPCKPANAVCSVSGDVTCLCQHCGSCMLLCSCHKCKRCSLYCRCEESTI